MQVLANFMTQHSDQTLPRFSIRSVCLCQQLGYEICRQLLVIHAVGGWDTMSALYGIGKASDQTTALSANKTLVYAMRNKSAIKDEFIAAGLSLWSYCIGVNQRTG